MKTLPKLALSAMLVTPTFADNTELAKQLSNPVKPRPTDRSGACASRLTFLFPKG